MKTHRFEWLLGAVLAALFVAFWIWHRETVWPRPPCRLLLQRDRHLLGGAQTALIRGLHLEHVVPRLLRK